MADSRELVTLAQLELLAKRLAAESAKLEGAIEALSVTDLVDGDNYYTKSEVYSKSETYTKAEVAAQIAAAGHLKRSVVTTLPAVNEAEANTIYMLESEDFSGTGNKYEEWMVVEGAWEKLGDWEVDLSDYVTKGSLATTLEDYVTNDDLEDAVSEAVGDIEATLGEDFLTKTEASSTYLTQTDAGNTYLTKTSAESTYLTKTDASSTYVAKKEGYDLISDADLAKLQALSAVDPTKVEASSTNGNIKINNVETKVYDISKETSDFILYKADIAETSAVTTMLNKYFDAE